jgi:hypothetical protein
MDTEGLAPGDTPYEPPVADLLTLGEEETRFGQPWPDYVARFGLTAEHVPELIRLATDRELNGPYDVTRPEAWAPVHAWRALGQLRAVEAARPLAELLAWIQDDDFALEELPRVFGLLGSGAIPALRALLRDPRADQWARVAAAGGLRHIAEAEPATRDEAVAAITEVLGLLSGNDPDFNALLISALIGMRAAETAPLIRRAFEADAVEESIVGDWEDVQIALGLLDQRITPRPHYHLELSPFAGASREWDEPRRAPGVGKKKQKAARKRKLERESRKRNRKKR